MAGCSDKSYRGHLRANGPELFRSSVEKYFRGFEEVPKDFVQTHKDAGVLITQKELLDGSNPKYVSGRKHVMVVGSAGTARSAILRRFLEDVSAGVLLMNSESMTIVIDLRYHSEDKVIAFPRIIFNHMSEEVSDETAAMAFAMLMSDSDKACFILIGLDTVPFDFETACEKIDDFWNVKTSVLLNKLLTGEILPKCKILSSCREYRLKRFKGSLRPDDIIQVGELDEQSVERIMRRMVGPDDYDTVMNIWKDSRMVCMLNGNPTCFEYNILTGGMCESPDFSHSIPMTFLELVLCCAYNNHFPLRPEDRKKENLPAIHMVKKLAYYGVQRQIYVFDCYSATEICGVTVSHAAALLAPYPFRDRKYYLLETRMRSVGRTGLSVPFYTFSSIQMQEFLCAVAVVELPCDEYTAFLHECIHKPRYHIVRRMLCALLMDQIVCDCACREEVMLGTQKDRRKRRKLLVQSMSEEFRNVKRRDLLEFLHAVSDSGGGGIDILPKTIEVVDLSHIQLFTIDMHAIAKSLLSTMEVGYLNLSNCNISANGLKAFKDVICLKGTKITRLNLDWNTEWKKHQKGVKAIGEIIATCKVKDFSINHCEVTKESLSTLSMELGSRELDTLRVGCNSTLATNGGYEILGELVRKQNVKHLHVFAKDVTDSITEDFLAGMGSSVENYAGFGE